MAAALGAIVSIAKVAFSVVGALSQGAAAKAQAKAQQQAYEAQARRQEESARLAAATGDRRVAERQRQIERTLSGHLAYAAASGAAPTSTDFLLEQGEIAGRGQDAKARDAYNAAIEARNYNLDAEESRYAGRVAQMNGRIASRNATFSAIGAGIGGLAQFGSYYQKFGAPRTAGYG